jgi:hypothetical protein
MKFFNLDCHISVIEDITNIFSDLGHTVDSWSISGHNWVMNKKDSEVKVVNQSTWGNLNPDMCDEFYNTYKDELDKYDGFICTYPPSFSMLYEKFNKPIILQIPIRYEVPFHKDKEKWLNFNDFLKKNIDKNKLFAVSNSLYDKKYFEFFVNRECELIPSICEYTKSKYNQKKDDFLLYSRLNVNIDNLINLKSLKEYKWSDLYEYKGVVIIPYNVSTMTIFEFYTANVPIFCPSEKFMTELYKNFNNLILSEISWNQIDKTSKKSIIECDISNDPNDFSNLNIFTKWLKFSDFYNQEWMPHIVYFDSFDDLVYKLNNIDLSVISRKMEMFNEERKIKIYNKWEKILNNIK